MNQQIAAGAEAVIERSDARIIHGDLTISNLILHTDDGDSGGDDRIYFIDFGPRVFRESGGVVRSLVTRPSTPAVTPL